MAKIISWSVKFGKAVDFTEVQNTIYHQFHLVLPCEVELNNQQQKANL